jgi:uncharacterized protein with HEPN domain
VRSDSQKLEKIADSIERILEYTAKGEKRFFANSMVQDAVIRNFQVIGEAIKDLSASLKNRHSDVQWREAAQFRDKITHDYLGVDLDIVWQTVEDDLPKLQKQIKKIWRDLLKQEEAQMAKPESKLKKKLEQTS